jgi:hypothetical protein
MSSAHSLARIMCTAVAVVRRQHAKQRAAQAALLSQALQHEYFACRSCVRALMRRVECDIMGPVGSTMGRKFLCP